MAINLFITDSPPTCVDRRERSRLLSLQTTAFWSWRFILMHFHPLAYFLLSQVTSTSFSFVSKLFKQALYYTFGDFFNKALKIPQGLQKPASFFSSMSEATVLSRQLHLWTGFTAVLVHRRASGLVSQSVWVCGRKQQWHGERRVLDATNLHVSHSVLYGNRSLMGEGGGTGTGMCPMFLLREIVNLL